MQHFELVCLLLLMDSQVLLQLCWFLKYHGYPRYHLLRLVLFVVLLVVLWCLHWFFVL
jgi:hypothetical protein